MGVKVYALDRHTYSIKDVSSTYLADDELDMISMSNNISALNIIGQQESDVAKNYQSVVFGSNVISVADRCCFGCVNLNSVAFQGDVQFIGVSAFCNVQALQAISFPSSLKSIGKDAFNSCTSLNTVAFPDSSISIGYMAFAGTSIENIDISIADGSDACIFGSCGVKHATVHGKLTDSLFNSCVNLQSVNVVDCGYIPTGCFSGCISLTNVNLPASLSSIASNAFYSCSTLSTLDLKNTLLTEIGDSFIGGTAIESLVFPVSLSSMESISSVSFLRGSNALSVTFLGLDDNYMRSHPDAFSTFGGQPNVVFFSSSGTKYLLNDLGDRLRVDSICIISIALTYEKLTTGPGGGRLGSLSGMTKDVNRFINVIKKAYGSNYDGVVRKVMKFRDTSSESSEQPTESNIMNAFNVCKDINPTLLLFHFSGHGIYGNGDESTGGILIKPGNSSTQAVLLNWTKLFNQFKRFSKIFVMPCCCHPMIPSTSSLRAAKASNESKNASNASIADMFEKFLKTSQQNNRSMSLKAAYSNGTDIPTKAAFWAAGKHGEETWEDDSNGHCFMTVLVNTFKASNTYTQQWTAMSKATLFNKTPIGTAVHPQVKYLNDYESGNKVFR